jgi:hypothetical protein
MTPMKNTFHTNFIIKSLDRKITKYFHWLIYVHKLFHSILEIMNKTHQLITCTLNKVGHINLKGQMLSFFFYNTWRSSNISYISMYFGSKLFSSNFDFFQFLIFV